MNTVDTKGLTCPRLLIMLKEALLEMKAGEKITVYTDNDTSLKSLVTYLKDQGVEPEVTTRGNVHKIIADRPQGNVASTQPEL